MHFSAICLKVHCPFKKCITKCMSSDTRGTEECFMNLLLLNNICSDDETSYILLILHLSTTRYILLLLNEGIFLIKFIYKLKKKMISNVLMYYKSTSTCNLKQEFRLMFLSVSWGTYFT